MTRDERHALAEEEMEKELDLIQSLGLTPHEALQSAFRFGRAYGLSEAAVMMIEGLPNGPQPPVESN